MSFLLWSLLLKLCSCSGLFCSWSHSMTHTHTHTHHTHTHTHTHTPHTHTHIHTHTHTHTPAVGSTLLPELYHRFSSVTSISDRQFVLWFFVTFHTQNSLLLPHRLINPNVLLYTSTDPHARHSSEPIALIIRCHSLKTTSFLSYRNKFRSCVQKAWRSTPLRANVRPADVLKVNKHTRLFSPWNTLANTRR